MQGQHLRCYKNPLLSRYLEHQIPVVRYGHELGERWSAKDSMVGAFEVSDHEVDVVGAEVVWGTKLHR